jgi:hypothetical protein
MNTQTMTARHTELLSDFTGVISGTVSARSIVGSGYKNTKQVAAQWLLKEMHNLENPSCQVSQVHVSSSGKPFASEASAIRSKVFKTLVDGEYRLINNAVVTDYGVMPTPDSSVGYMIYVEYKHLAS